MHCSPECCAAARSLRVLTTSQEPVHVEGEQVYRLGPLSVPEPSATHDATAYGAVRLFVERVRALLPRFELTEAESGPVVEICRRLDGLPLAIELAAARVPVLGVAGVRDRLGERFRILTGGSRVAPKRHQTLARGARLEPGPARRRRARAPTAGWSAFVGDFSLESAQELAADDGIAAWAVLEHLSSLVDKSLVIAEGRHATALSHARVDARARAGTAGRGQRDRPLDPAPRRDHGACAGACDRAAPHRPRARRDGQRAQRLRMGLANPATTAAAVALATLPSMVIAVDGAVQEARQRLLDVEPPRRRLVAARSWWRSTGSGSAASGSMAGCRRRVASKRSGARKRCSSS